ncbi:MAG TPA: aldehyde dehydrogenase family protein, partial [Citricoccus sp.]
MTTKYTTTNPATGQIEREFPTLQDGEVEGVLARSHAAYDGWRSTSAQERAQVLAAVAQAYRDRAKELGQIIAQEMGKPLPQAIGEAKLAGKIYQWYADHGPELLETETLDPQGAVESVVQTTPLGSIVGIMPWNYPYYQVARFAAPNLMAGNTIILKHAPICGASSEAMEQILHEAGVPKDAYINVYATNEQVATMIADPRVQGVSLTGSERAGTAVAKTAAENLKKAVLELGGSDAMIVLDDADLEATAKVAAKSRLSNAGQACNSPKRMIVPNDKLEKFVSIVVDTFENATVG